MVDRELVITHLQIIHTWADFARERDLQFFTKKHLEDITQWTTDALALLKEQGTVVRCKDCKKWHTNCLPSCGRHGCDVLGDYTNPDDYCSFAERREGR